MKLEQLFPKDLYHSYVIEGDPNKTAYLLREFLESRGEIDKQSPDMIFEQYDSFAVLDSERIKEWHQNKSIAYKKKICIIGTKFINRDAEQSLLKIIEEPNPYTHFFIIVPDSSLLLDTTLSRVQLIKNIESEEEDNILAKDFLNSTITLRIEKIAAIVKEFKDNENSGGIRYYAITLINGIERIIYEKWKKDINNKNEKFILDELKNSREYLSIPGSSVKMILEHLALVI